MNCPGTKSIFGCFEHKNAFSYPSDAQKPCHVLYFIRFNEFGSFATFTPKSLMPYNNQTFLWLTPLFSGFYCASFYPAGRNLREEHISRGFKKRFESTFDWRMRAVIKMGGKLMLCIVFLSLQCAWFPCKVAKIFSLFLGRGECISCVCFSWSIFQAWGLWTRQARKKEREGVRSRGWILGWCDGPCAARCRQGGRH